MRRKLDLIESSPLASAESWREESEADDKETVAVCDTASSTGTETDIKDQPLQSRLPENHDELLAR